MSRMCGRSIVSPVCAFVELAETAARCAEADPQKTKEEEKNASKKLIGSDLDMAPELFQHFQRPHGNKTDF